MSTRTKILTVVAALAVLVLALSRGEETSAQLQALRADPMATYVPPRGTLVDTDSQSEGTSLGELVPARHTRLFKLRSPEALEDARAAATAAGWQLVGKAERESFVGTKRVQSGRLELTLVLIRNRRLLPEGIQPPALSVSLHHLGS